ncbi:HGxxPAAW family protein [Arthrobacter sp. MDT3-44]
MASDTRSAATRNTPANHAQMGDETIGHGNSPAAWTCVLIMLAGAALSSFAYVFASTEGNHDFGTLLFWVGIGIMVVGLIVGFMLRKIGYGVGGSKLKNNGH